jgi:hypothetical protein
VCSPTPPRRRSAPGVVGSAVWNAVLIRVGYALGAYLDRLSGWVGSYSDIVLVAVVATAIQERGGRWDVQGDPTEGALIVAARKAGLSAEALEGRFERVGEVPFSSERMEIEDVLPLEEATKAHERVETGHTRGKIVLRVGAGPATKRNEQMMENREVLGRMPRTTALPWY